MIVFLGLGYLTQDDLFQFYRFASKFLLLYEMAYILWMPSTGYPYVKWDIFEVSEIAQWLCKLATKVNVGLNPVFLKVKTRKTTRTSSPLIFTPYFLSEHTGNARQFVILTNRKICMTVQCTAQSSYYMTREHTICRANTMKSSSAFRRPEFQSVSRQNCVYFSVYVSASLQTFFQLICIL